MIRYCFVKLLLQNTILKLIAQISIDISTFICLNISIYIIVNYKFYAKFRHIILYKYFIVYLNKFRKILTHPADFHYCAE